MISFGNFLSLSKFYIYSAYYTMSQVPPGAPRMLDEDGRTVGEVLGPFFEVQFAFNGFCFLKSD